MTKNKNWEDLNSNETYKLNMAEFRGMTIQALQNIKEDLKEVKQNQLNLQSQVNNQKLIAMVMGGVAGVVAAIASPFKNG